MTAIEHAAPVWTLGERMWKARKDAGLEQADVAKKLGVSRALVSRWERDQSDPGTRQLQAFAELTEVSASWLMAAFGYISNDAGDTRSLTVIEGTPNPKRRSHIQSPLVASV